MNVTHDRARSSSSRAGSTHNHAVDVLPRQGQATGCRSRTGVTTRRSSPSVTRCHAVLGSYQLPCLTPTVRFCGYHAVVHGARHGEGTGTTLHQHHTTAHHWQRERANEVDGDTRIVQQMRIPLSHTHHPVPTIIVPFGPSQMHTHCIPTHAYTHTTYTTSHAHTSSPSHLHPPHSS